MKHLLFVFLCPSLLIAQPHLVGDKDFAVGVEYAQSYDADATARGIGAGITIAGRLHVDYSSATLTPGDDDPSIESSTSRNFSIALLPLRSADAGGFFGFHATWISGTVRPAPGQYRSEVGVSGNAFGVLFGVTAGARTRVQPVPSFFVHHISVGTMAARVKGIVAGGELDLRIAATSNWLVIPYAGASMFQREWTYGFGIRTVVRFDGPADDGAK